MEVQLAAEVKTVPAHVVAPVVEYVVGINDMLKAFFHIKDGKREGRHIFLIPEHVAQALVIILKPGKLCRYGNLRRGGPQQRQLLFCGTHKLFPEAVSPV